MIFRRVGCVERFLEANDGLVHRDGLLFDHGLDVARDVEVEVVLPNLVEGYHPADAFDVPVLVVEAVDTLYVFGQEFVLGAAGLELAGGVDKEHVLAVVSRFGLAEDEDAGGEARAVEEVRAQADDRFEAVGFEKVAPDPAFFAARKRTP